ncbi:MAG: amino acid permease [Nitrospirae bacterium]|nr:amino acid permease [Nitrospirota bacterium]
MIKRLLLKKDINSLLSGAFDESTGLKRALSTFELVSLGVGGIVGAGIFVLTGNAAAQYAGPAVTLSFLLALVACGFAGFCYAELASMIPVAGSAYTYAYASMGEFIAWIIGWDLILEYFLGATTVAIGWSGYVVSFLKDLDITFPRKLSGPLISYNPTLNSWHLTGNIFNLPAFTIILIVTILLITGIRASSRANTAIVIIKVAILLVFITTGLFYIKPELWHPFIPPNTGTFGSFGMSGILRAAGLVFFAYIGFDSVSTAASEAKNPQKSLPVGILGSLAICTLLYISVSLILTGIVHYSKLGGPAPIATATDAMGLTFLATLIKIGAIAGLTSVILVLVLGQTRIFYAMSKDGLLPPMFSLIHKRYRTPHVSTIVVGVAASLASTLLPIDIVSELVSIGTLLAFFIVCAGVLILKYTRPEIKRIFSVPWGPVIPVGGMISCLYLMAALPSGTWYRLVIWLILGLIVYFTYSIKKSSLNKTT